MENKIMIVSYLAFSHPHEEEFDSNTTIEQVHKVLSDVCNTYLITEIRYK